MISLPVLNKVIPLKKPFYIKVMGQDPFQRQGFE